MRLIVLDDVLGDCLEYKRQTNRLNLLFTLNKVAGRATLSRVSVVLGLERMVYSENFFINCLRLTLYTNK